jgi:hypothetical protein
VGGLSPAHVLQLYVPRPFLKKSPSAASHKIALSSHRPKVAVVSSFWGTSKQ